MAHHSCIGSKPRAGVPHPDERIRICSCYHVRLQRVGGYESRRRIRRPVPKLLLPEVQERTGRVAALPHYLGNDLLHYVELRGRHRRPYRDEIAHLRLHVRLRAERLPQPHSCLPHKQGPAHHLPHDTLRVQTRPARKRAAHRRACRTGTRRGDKRRIYR